MKYILGFIFFGIIFYLMGISADNRKKRQGREPNINKPSCPPIDGTEEEFALLQKVKDLFNSGSCLSGSNIYTKLGMPEDMEAESYFPFVKDSEISKLFYAYCNAISFRFYLSYMMLDPFDHDLYRLNLNKDEILYHVMSNIGFYDSSTIRETSTGRFFFTDKRVLFVGFNGLAKSYTYKSILSYKRCTEKLYTNSEFVTLSIANQKPKNFRFLEYYTNDIIQGGYYEFDAIITRSIDNTQNTDLT